MVYRRTDRNFDIVRDTQIGNYFEQKHPHRRDSEAHQLIRLVLTILKARRCLARANESRPKTNQASRSASEPRQPEPSAKAVSVRALRVYPVVPFRVARICVGREIERLLSEWRSPSAPLLI